MVQRQVQESLYIVSHHPTSVIGVAATGEDGKIASFSNYGKLIDIAAPGAKIVSTKMGGGYKSMS